MKTICAEPFCAREGIYFMCWRNNEGEKHSGLVCAAHDKFLGRRNLVAAGMSLKEAILFERYLRETEDHPYPPDWKEWLKQYIKPLREPGGSYVEQLGLPSAISNALRRNDVTTLEELISLTDDELARFRTIGPTRIREIREALDKYLSSDG